MKIEFSFSFSFLFYLLRNISLIFAGCCCQGAEGEVDGEANQIAICFATSRVCAYVLRGEEIYNSSSSSSCAELIWKMALLVVIWAADSVSCITWRIVRGRELCVTDATRSSESTDEHWPNSFSLFHTELTINVILGYPQYRAARPRRIFFILS